MNHVAESAPRLFAVIPAAGLSRRMGTPKLLLKWQERSLISHLLHSLSDGHVDAAAILIRDDDDSLRDELECVLRELPAFPVHIVTTPEPTADMTASVTLLMDWLAKNAHVGRNDGLLLVPADHPIVEPATLRVLRREWAAFPHEVIIPVFQGERGHPVIFPGSLPAALRDIPAGHGLNWLTRSGRLPAREVPVETASVVLDIDTQEDFAQLIARRGP